MIPVFTYVEDAARFVASLKTDNDALKNLLSERCKDLNAYKTNNQDLKLLEGLSANYNKLELTEFQASNQFKDARDLSRLLNTIALEKLDAESCLSKAFSAMDSCARNLCGEEFLTKVSELKELLSSNAVFNSSISRMLVHQDKGLVCTAYIILYDVKTANGLVIPELYVCLQRKGKNYQLWLCPHFVLPNLCQGLGQKIDKVGLPVTLGALLEAEGVSSNLGILPINAKLEDRLLEFRDYVLKANVHRGEVRVSIRGSKKAPEVGLELHTLLANELGIEGKELLVRHKGNVLTFTNPKVSLSRMSNVVKDALKLRSA